MKALSLKVFLCYYSILQHRERRLPPLPGNSCDPK